MSHEMKEHPPLVKVVANNKVDPEDIVKKKFGMITVIEYIGSYRKEAGAQKGINFVHIYNGQCECGSIKSYARLNVIQKSKNGTGCGCVPQKKRLYYSTEDFIPEFVGKWFYDQYFVVGLSTLKSENNKPLWICTCKCGNEFMVETHHIRKGSTKSCGCLRYGPQLGSKIEGSKRVLYRDYRQTAKRRGLDFQLTLDECHELTQRKCTYCGKDPENRIENQHGGVYLYNGIDRINNNIGYLKTNCTTCCRRCNVAKSTYDVVDFKEWVIRVYNNLNLDNQKD